MAQNNVHVNVEACDDKTIFSEGSLSSFESDTSTEGLGIKPLRSNFLNHRSRPTTALAKKERPNLSATTWITKRRLKVANTIKKDLKDEDVLWIQNTFTCKSCVNYVDNGGVCCCGRPKEEHKEFDECETGTSWNSEKHCSVKPTNAFGKLKLLSGSYHTARYLRLSDTSDYDDILQLLKEFWHLQIPGTLLSVLGSCDTCIPHKLHQVVQRDLAKVGKITGAWIFTNGVEQGVSKVVGNMLSTHGYPVPAIAFCAWGMVDSAGCLEDEDVEDPEEVIRYEPAKHVHASKVLNPNHTHFLLIDDGTTARKTECNDQLRYNFEEHLCKQLNIPLLYILIGGAEEDGKLVHSLLKSGNIVIFVKGSGGFADDYCDFTKHIDDQLDGVACTCLKGNPCEEILDKMDHDFETTVLLQLHTSHHENLQIYDYTEVDDFDAYLLKLLVTTNNDLNIDEQLDMACKWSRLDVAEHILSAQLDATTGAKYCSGLTKTLFHALLWDHPEFCGILIENGADIYDIQHNLLSLYEAAYFSPRCSHVIQLLDKYSDFNGTSAVKMPHVDALLNRLIGKGYVASSGMEVDPYYELTLWAVIMLRRDQAKLLWRYTQDPVRCALVATMLLYSLKHNAYLERDDDKRRCKLMFEIFEELALSVLDQAWLSDSENCKKAMLSKWTRIKGFNYLDLAFHAHARTFMAHSACQEIISAGWRGQFKRDTSFIRIILILVVPPLCVTPLVPFDRKVNYRTAIQGKYKMIYIDKLTGVEALYRRASAFYSAPVTKFWMFLLTYMVFLGFHSYTLLYNMNYFHPDKDIADLVTWTELVVWIWLATIIISESVDCIQSSLNRHTKMNYFMNSWNRIDMICILLYVIGIIFRVLPDPHCYAAGRTIMACDSIMLFIRLLILFEYKPSLGPMLLILREMTKDLAVFILLIAINIMGFGIAYVALLIPPGRLTWNSLSAIFVYPYFQMFGEFYIEDFELQQNSTYIDKETWQEGPDSDIRRGQSFIAMCLLVLWLLMSTVGLVNLLIAMFSDTYRCIKDNQLIIWKYQRYRLLSEYRASYVPAPFSLLHYAARALHKCCVTTRRKRHVQPNKRKQSHHWKDCMIRTAMQDARDEFLSGQDGRNESNEILNKLQTVEHHLSIIRRVGNRASSLYA